MPVDQLVVGATNQTAEDGKHLHGYVLNISKRNPMPKNENGMQQKGEARSNNRPLLPREQQPSVAEVPKAL